MLHSIPRSVKLKNWINRIFKRNRSHYRLFNPKFPNLSILSIFQIPGLIFPKIRTTTWGDYFIPDFEVTKSGLRYSLHFNREEIKKIATSLRELGKNLEALDQINIAAKINPKDPYIFIQMGFICSALGRKENEIAAYKKALEADPDFFIAIRNIGKMYREIENFDLSLQWYTQGLTLTRSLCRSSALRP